MSRDAEALVPRLARVAAVVTVGAVALVALFLHAASARRETAAPSVERTSIVRSVSRQRLEVNGASVELAVADVALAPDDVRARLARGCGGSVDPLAALSEPGAGAATEAAPDPVTCGAAGGGFRYYRATAHGAGTRVSSVSCDAPLDFAAAQEADAPGSDLPRVPRPDGMVRVLSSAGPRRIAALAMYAGPGTDAAAVAAGYARDAERAGLAVEAIEDDDRSMRTLALRDGHRHVLAVIDAGASPGRVVVTLLEAR